MNSIYLDYQASTPIDPRVVDVIARSMCEDFANPSSEDHKAGWDARSKIEAARGRIAQCICAQPDEIIFTSGATEANNIGVLGAALAAPPERRKILVSAIEHKAVLEAARAAVKHGFKIEMVPVDCHGIINLERLEEMLDPTVAVVSLMAVNNEIGTVQPIVQASELVVKSGAFFHCDATQAPAAMPLDVAAWNVDAASFSGHKIYGPKGIGALYVSGVAPWRPTPLHYGGGQEEGLRPGTLPTPLCVGFAEAMHLIVSNGSTERAAIAKKRERLAYRLKQHLPGLTITAESQTRHPGNLHIRLPGVEASDLIARLQPEIAAATGSACTSGMIGTSHVLEALGWTAQWAREAIRLSAGRFTTDAEIDQAASAIIREASASC